MKSNFVKTIQAVAAVALFIIAVGAIQIPVLAHDPSARILGQEMKAPHTAQEHRDRALQYEKKAAEYRQDAETHKKMLADYSKTVAKSPKETGENAYIKKMRMHCEKYMKAAEALAQEAEDMAKYHALRAKEVEGK